MIERAAEAGDVDAGMVVEILVLGRQERRLDAVGHRLDRQIEAALARELAHQRAVGSMHARRHRRLVAGQHLVVGQVLGQVADIDADRRRDEQRQHRADAEEIADQTNHARSSVRIGKFLCDADGIRKSPEPSRSVCRQPLCRRCGQNTADASCACPSVAELMRSTVVESQRSCLDAGTAAIQPPAAVLAAANSGDRRRRCWSAALPRQSALRSCSSSLALER